MPWARRFWDFSPFQPYSSLFFSLNDLFSPLQRLADMVSDVLFTEHIVEARLLQLGIYRCATTTEVASPTAGGKLSAQVDEAG